MEHRWCKEGEEGERATKKRKERTSGNESMLGRGGSTNSERERAHSQGGRTKLHARTTSRGVMDVTVKQVVLYVPNLIGTSGKNGR